jgi:hypothetical protein
MAKNKFLFILAAVSLLSLAACGNANNSSSAASESSTSAKASSSNAESSSQKPTSEGLVFQLNDDKQSYRVSGYEGTGANVLIPETYESLPVTSIGNKAFCGNFRVQSVAFAANSSLTSIGERAFADCTVPSAYRPSMGDKGDINGFVHGKKGTAHVQTFGAGGENVGVIVNVKCGPIYHYRTRVDAVK